MRLFLLSPIVGLFIACPLNAQEQAAGWYLKQCHKLEREIKAQMKKARRCNSKVECFLTNEVSDRYSCCQFDVISRKAKVAPIKKKILEMENLNCPGPQDCPCEDWTKTNHEISCVRHTCTIRPKKRN